MNLENYCLPKNIEVPSHVKAVYRSGGFDVSVRNWHLERLPRFETDAAKYIHCPYCGKLKDPRSMQIDHIIPVRAYVRYKLYSSLKNIKSDSVEVMELCAQAHELNSDMNNLLLCCMRCNTSKQDRLMASVDYFNIENRLRSVGNYALEERVKQNGKIARAIEAMSSNVFGVNVREFVLLGASWSTTTINTRRVGSAPLLHTTRTFNPFGVLVKTKKDKEELKDSLGKIHNVVVSVFGTNRPQWKFKRIELEAQQPPLSMNNEILRFCFYCCGLFKKQAFQLDHIRPASLFMNCNSATYSDAANLIPVCRTCNTSKGDKILSKVWLDNQVVCRQKDGLPGIEHAKHNTYSGDQLMRLAKKKRDAVLFPVR